MGRTVWRTVEPDSEIFGLRARRPLRCARVSIPFCVLAMIARYTSGLSSAQCQMSPELDEMDAPRVQLEMLGPFGGAAP